MERGLCVMMVVTHTLYYITQFHHVDKLQHAFISLFLFLFFLDLSDSWLSPFHCSKAGGRRAVVVPVV